MKILIIDDSGFIALICKNTLEKAGHEVVGTAFDGIEGVQMALATKPDLAIVDIALPKKNGLEVARLIKESLPSTHILAISAIEEDWLRDKAIQAGCYDFLEKPFDTEALLEYVNKSQSLGELKYG